MTPEELLAAQKRDAATGDLWFTGPESFTALAARDRRALLADNEALRKERDTWKNEAYLANAHQSLDHLLAEVEALRKDAERYRFYRKWYVIPAIKSDIEIAQRNQDAFDAAIDAAREKTT